MKNTLLLAACMAVLLLAGCATTGGDNGDTNPRPDPRPFPECPWNPNDPFCRSPFPNPPIPPLPRPLPPHK